MMSIADEVCDGQQNKLMDFEDPRQRLSQTDNVSCHSCCVQTQT